MSVQSSQRMFIQDFVSAITGYLSDHGESMSSFARRWGKSRQYVSRLLNHKENNVTVETLVEALALIGRRPTFITLPLT